ncbi:hypothetical protein ACH9L7_18355 (plasmid) [Haloferax sp. S1W]|uniref:hypothetical protein n=1 Tax=Haloferax sp. S1W TaxID=3377110 RepID=UPI0037C5F96C
MSDNNDSSSSFSRRNILKSAAGGAAGLSGLSQVPVAWAQPTESELDELEGKPNVQAVLSELGLDALPDDMQKLSNSFGDGEGAVEFEIWEGELPYGTLHVGRIEDLTNVVFEFAENVGSTAPQRFRSIPDGTEPLVSATGGEAFVKRSATEDEEAAISQLLPESGTMVASTTTIHDGFQVDLVRHSEKRDELEQLQYRATIDGEDDVHPVFEESSSALQNASVSRTIQTRGFLDGVSDAVNDVADGLKGSYDKWQGDLDAVKGWVDHKPYKKMPGAKKISNLSKSGVKAIVAQAIVGESLEAVAGDCGEDCTDCAFTASDLILNCHKCRIFASASLSGIGAASAVLLIVCVWQFCKLPTAINKCSSCLECATNAANV